MRKIVFVMLLVSAFSTIMAQQSERSCFRLGGDVGIAHVGYLAEGENVYTDYLQLQITPDYRFSRHFGVRADLGWGASFMSNASGRLVVNPTFFTQQVTLFLAPYFEWDFGKCYVDVAAGCGFRIRLAQWKGNLFMPLTSCGVGVGLQPRVGFHVSPKCDVSVGLRMEKTLYDPMAKVLFRGEKHLNGIIFLNVGAAYVF